MTGAKRIVAVGSSSAVGVRSDDRPAGVAHAVSRLIRAKDDVALCGTDVIALPNHDWSQPALGVLRCAQCEELAALN
jgi:hypothetical protein